MRRTFRQLAAVKPSAYLEPNTPTGLTGLNTHPSPRSTLLYLYSRTLDKLSEFPESSLYRQSAEAVTKHRLSIVKSVVPEGLEAWRESAKKIMEARPESFVAEDNIGGNVVSLIGKMTKEKHGGSVFVTSKPEAVPGPDDEWDGEAAIKGGVEVGAYMKYETGGQKITLPEEPILTAEQVGEVENRIGAGLIEEVIEVAAGELELAHILLEAKAWEDLVEKPAEGQWDYFKRNSVSPQN
ncbi:hypothetical protein HYFRA_00001139 [Hymenoscyphus fraxineus]|uniref:NADH-ubiquinone oxidoreductase 29.9 kDa subunit n=1 Tax=Hymenoscyphus fraxineus TaxID=746836 RepID=A0A9N9KVQ6_9HELO|nr:hypothetical protein HYFRA_00001139 [Hymenoscyphus fraxineus]